MDLKGSKTESNLISAFSGESMARVKYEIYASRLKANGLEKYASVTDEISKNEREHAEIWLKLLEGETPSSAEMLADAIEGEKYEYSEMYQGFADTAESEGFTEIATLFREVAEIERAHTGIYRDMLTNVENDSVFSKERPTSWVCMACGHRHDGEEAPLACSVCGHLRSYQQIECLKL